MSREHSVLNITQKLFSEEGTTLFIFFFFVLVMLIYGGQMLGK